MKKNPFIYGDTVRGENFTDRESELAELYSDAISAQNVIIYSPRKYGKTSLIIRLMEKLKKEDKAFCVYVDCTRISSKIRLIDEYAKALARGLASRFDEMKATLKEFFPNFLPKLVIKGDSEIPDIEFEFSTKEKSFRRHFDTLLELPQNIALKKKKRVFIVFDEFQEIVDLEDIEIEKSFRSFMQHHSEVCYIFMGSKKHLISEIFTDAARPFYNFGKIFRLRKIPENDMRNFLKSKFEATGFVIFDDALKKIIQATSNHPYYVQMLAHILWFETLESKQISTKAVDNAFSRIIANCSELYTNIWDSLTFAQRNLLIALLKTSETDIFSDAFRQEYNLNSKISIKNEIKKLMDKNLIEKENGLISLGDVFFEEWIRKTIL